MTRKIQPEQSTQVNSAASLVLPIGARLMAVKGEADGKPTYDFTILVTSGSASGPLVYACKYVGTMNGKRVNLWKEFPVQSNVTSATTTFGTTAYNIIAGTGVTLQVFYASGTVST